MRGDAPQLPATAARRRSTESSNSTGGSREDIATATTTDYACSWSPADCSSHRNSEEPLDRIIVVAADITEPRVEAARMPNFESRSYTSFRRSTAKFALDPEHATAAAASSSG